MDWTDRDGMVCGNCYERSCLRGSNDVRSWRNSVLELQVSSAARTGPIYSLETGERSGILQSSALTSSKLVTILLSQTLSSCGSSGSAGLPRQSGYYRALSYSAALLAQVYARSDLSSMYRI